jgi:phosphoglycerol geranylgeranyltransferase
MSVNIYHDLLEAKKKNHKKFAVLIDPDKLRLKKLGSVIELAKKYKVDYFFIGGSLIVNDMLDKVLSSIREACDIPMILFPGNSYQLSYRADGILFLSLISGRNAELLIGNHVITAPFLKISPLEVIPTGYMLIDGGVPTTVSYISNTQPIPSNKNDIAISTALAGELLGLKTIFMDAGSGAQNPVPSAMIKAVREVIDVPIIIGGGIRTADKIMENLEAGADVIVIGDAIESEPEKMEAYSRVFEEFNSKQNKG